MTNFKQFMENAPFGDDYWTKRMAHFQAASNGEKSATLEPEVKKATLSPNISRSLTPEEIRRLKLTPNDYRVWQGSTADAPSIYQYVFAKRIGKYLTNPNYRE